jgi:hypothetical protein
MGGGPGRHAACRQAAAEPASAAPLLPYACFCCTHVHSLLLPSAAETEQPAALCSLLLLLLLLQDPRSPRPCRAAGPSVHARLHRARSSAASLCCAHPSRARPWPTPRQTTPRGARRATTRSPTCGASLPPCGTTLSRRAAAPPALTRLRAVAGRGPVSPALGCAAAWSRAEGGRQGGNPPR